MEIRDLNSIRAILFDNLSAKQTILKNTFWLSLSTVTNKLLALALVIYAARILGAEGYGQFSFALALVSLLMVFSDLGLAAIVNREFAKEKQEKEELYSIFSLKIILALVTFIIVFLSSIFVSPEKNTQSLILTLSVFFLLNSLMGVFYSIFHARQKMEYESWFEAVQSLLILLLGLFALFNFPSPKNLSYAYAVSALAAFTAVSTFFHFRIFPLKLKWRIAVWKKFLRMSWPLALVGLFGLVYSYTDSVMLGYWGMLKETGWYNAAYKIMTVSLVPMGLIGASFYPALSKFSGESKEKLQKAWGLELEIMIAIALPLVVGGIVLASPIMNSFYPSDFTPAIPAFQILIGGAGLIFLYRPLYDVMIVLNQQNKTFWITMAGAVLNVVLNFMLIPRYSLYGAAFATVFTHVLVLGSFVFLIKKFTFLRFPALKIILTLLAAIIAALTMYLTVKYLLTSSLHIFFLVPLAAAVYFSLFFIIRKYILLRYLRYAYI